MSAFQSTKCAAVPAALREAQHAAIESAFRSAEQRPHRATHFQQTHLLSLCAAVAAPRNLASLKPGRNRQADGAPHLVPYVGLL